MGNADWAMNISDKYAFWRWPAKIRSLSCELDRLKAEHARVVAGQSKLLEWVKVTHRLESRPEGIRALFQDGKRLIALVLLLFISQPLLAQPSPPVLRQPLTTNSHFGPLPAEGHVPIWNAAANKWSNNIPSGGAGGSLTTNANQFLGVPLAIKDGAFLTNLNIQSSLQVSNGHTYLAGPVTNLIQLNLPHLTVSRSAIINAQGDVTNSSADSNWSIYSTNVWNDRQGGSIVLSNLVGTGALTNANVFQPANANLTNWALYPTNVWNDRQFGSQNLTNWSNIPTGSMANVVSTTFLTNWANAISNYVTAATNSASVTNWITTRQPASANLTNWSNIPTGAMANVVATDYLTNWANAISNLAQTKQHGSSTLTNLSGTGAITNVFSASLSNATMKPVVFPSANNFATNYTGRFFGLEAGGNVTLTPNGSNIVIAASVSGSGISTNANQFGASVELTIRDGAFLTNLNVETSLQVSNGHTYLAGPVTNLTQLNLPHLTVSRSAIINAQGDVTNSSADSNWSLYTTNVWNDRQGGSQNLTNWSNIPTGAMANVVSTTFLTNWANAVSNYVTAATNSASVTNWIGSRQPASTILTNLSGTGAITNLFSPTLSNATIKPLVVGVGDAAGATNTTGEIRGIQAGANITLTENGSNYVIASTGGGGVAFSDLLWTNEPSGRIHPVVFTNRVEVQTPITIGTNSQTFALAPNSNDILFAYRDITKSERWNPRFEIGVFSNSAYSIAFFTLGQKDSGIDFDTVDENGNLSSAVIHARSETGPGGDPEITLITTNGFIPFSTRRATNLVLNNITYQFPFSQGSAGTVLTNDGTGALGWGTDQTSAGGSVVFSDLVWTNDAGTIKPNAFPTNVLLRVDVPDDGVGTNFYWDATTYRANGASKLFALYNGGSNALTIGPFGGIHIGRAAAAATPALGNVLSVDYDTVLGEPGTAVINWNARQSAVGYFGNGSFSTSTNQSNLNINSFDGVALASAFDVTSRYTNITFTLHGQNASGIRGVRLSPMSPTIGLNVPTNYLFNSFYRLTNIHTLFSLQNSNTPMFEVNGIGDLKLLKRIPYSWPSAQGAAQTVLTNDGSGNLGWGAVVVGGPAAITNLISLTLSNATIKPLVVGVGDAAGATNVTGNIRGLEAGTGITLTPNGSNYVIASTATGGGITTNANQFAASVELAIKSGALLTNTLHYPSNFTSPAVIQLASVGQGTNLTEWRGTNGLIGLAVSSNGLAWVQTRLDLANAVAFRTNQIDLKLNTYQAFNTALVTNLVLQITNALEGVTTRIDAYGNGRLGGGRTNAWQLLCVAPTGFNIYWPPGTTNGNYDVLVNSNQLVSFTFLGGLGSTNILASYRVLEGIGAN